MLAFARYPFAEVNHQGNGISVILRDARYERHAKSGFGVVAIPLNQIPRVADILPVR